MKNFPDLAVGAIVYGAAGKCAKVLSIDGELLIVNTPAGIRTISTSKVARVRSSLSPPGKGFHIGDRVTLFDKYQVRAADVGTVEAINDKGIQILWYNKIPGEPNLKQPPMLWRTFKAEELELVDRSHHQN
jgi:hypothetical protein